MSDRFGDAFDNLPMRRKGPGSEFMKRFEIIKRDFGHSDEESVYELPLNMTVEDPNPDHFDEEERLVIINRQVFILYDSEHMIDNSSAVMTCDPCLIQ